MSKVTEASGITAAAALAIKYDPDLLCEEFIAGEELTCPILGNGPHARALPVVRIAAPDGAYDYNNKYFTDDVKYHCPSGLPEAFGRGRLSRLGLPWLGSCRHHAARF
jgi:D-alanine-D-alanine ligase